MNGKSNFFFLIFFLLSLSLYSQNNFTFKVIDESKLPLEDVLAVVKDSLTQKILFYTYSNNKGEVYINEEYIKSSLNVINFNLIGYRSIAFNLKYISDNPIIRLEISASQLNEVIIESKSFLKKRDTIVFFANRFKDINDDKVEDLLRKIPGLNIEADGTIKIGDKEVEKVMVDGDDFFEKGYKILTKSMPANSINTVELIDKYSRNKLLKNIENSNKVALNLTLNDDFRGKWFGNFLLGVSNRPLSNYEVKLNLMNFKKRHKYYFLTNFNTIGIECLVDFKKTNPSNQEDISFDNKIIENVLKNRIEKPFFIKPERYTFNNSKLVSLNSINDFKIFKIKINSHLIQEDLSYIISKFENFNILNTNNNINNSYKLHNSNLSTTFQIEKDIDKSQNIESLISFSRDNSSFRNSTNFNGIAFNESNFTPIKSFIFKNTFTKKLDSLSVFLVNYESKYSEIFNDYNINPVLYLGFFNGAYESLKQKTHQYLKSHNFKINYIKKELKGNIFEATFLFQNQTQNLKSSLFLNDNINIDFNNNIFNNSTRFSLDLKYDYNFKKIQLKPILILDYISNDLNNNNIIDIQNFIFLKPSLNVNYQFNHKNNFSFLYNYNVFLNTLNNLNQNYIHDSFRNFYINKNNFKELNESTFRFTHLKVDYDRKIFLTNIVSFIKSHNYITNNSFLSQDVFVTENYFVKDKNFLTIISNVDYFYKKISSTLKMSNGFNFINFENIINQNYRKINNNTYFSSFSFHSNFSGNFNFITETRFEWNRIRVNTELNKMFNYNLKLILNYKMGKNIYLFLRNEMQQILAQGTWQDRILFSDLNFRIHFKNNKSKLNLTINNIFDQKYFNFVNNTDIGVFENKYNLQSRMFLLRYEFSF